MATYLYGLLLADNAARVPARVQGIRGAHVRLIPCGALSALVSTWSAPPSTAPVSVDDVRAHDATLQVVVDAGVTVAAVRFRQTFADDEDASRHVRERGERVTRVLQEHDGTIEMRLLLPNPVKWPGAAEPAPMKAGPGRAYLDTLRREEPPSFRRMIPQARGEASSALRNGVAIAHLVHRSELDDYRSQIAMLPELRRARIVGPLALYSFVEGIE